MIESDQLGRPVTRRDLVMCALGACFTLISVSVAAQQPPKVPVVGVLVTHAKMTDPIFNSLRDGLRELGYEDGRNVKVHIVTAEGKLDLLPSLATQLVRLNVDVIISPNSVSVRAAQNATSAIPIVGLFFDDPVVSGAVDRFGRPGGNVTGIYALHSDLDGKRLELIKETLPGASHFAVFWTRGFGTPIAQLKRQADRLGMKLVSVEISGPGALQSAVDRATREKVGAVLLQPSPMFYVYSRQVALSALEARLPMCSFLEGTVEEGALMSYGVDSPDTFRRAALYVDRLLKGAKPSDLPIEQMPTLRLAINLRTARALGITIPESVLLRADRLIR
jgi:putative ABC transport system substrate-binding protein